MKNAKRIILKFHNGYWDGQTLDSRSQDRTEAFLAKSYFESTNGGTIGNGFCGMSPEASEYIMKHGLDPAQLGDGSKHKYTVTERVESENEILIQFDYSVQTPKEL